MSRAISAPTAKSSRRAVRAKRLPASERHEQILDAAEVVFASSGYRDVGTAAVAAQAGVSEPTLYRYFDSKRDLYLALLDRNSSRLHASWQQIVDSSPDPISALMRIGIDYSDQLAENPGPFLLRARSLLETGDPLVAERSRATFWRTFEFVEKLYQAAAERRQIPADSDSRSLAWLFMAVGGLLDQFLLMGVDPPSQDELARMMAVVWPRDEAPPAASKPRKKK